MAVYLALLGIALVDIHAWKASMQARELYANVVCFIGMWCIVYPSISNVTQHNVCILASLVFACSLNRQNSVPYLYAIH